VRYEAASAVCYPRDEAASAYPVVMREGCSPARSWPFLRCHPGGWPRSHGVAAFVPWRGRAIGMPKFLRSGLSYAERAWGTRWQPV